MKKKLRMALLLTLCAALLSGCVPLLETESSGDGTVTVGGRHLAVEKDGTPAAVFPEDESLYAGEDTDVVCFYVTVLGGNAADGTDHSLLEVNRYLNLQGMTGVEKIKTEVLVQVGDEEGPLEGEVGFNDLSSNATMNVRGRTSTGYPQKSYRITLFDNAGFWRGQRAIALNKHPADITRLRNALYFKLLQDVPAIPSLRTQFVHLYMRDQSGDTPQTAYTDCGLYTQVELPNNRYLRNHALSMDGSLYKANMCEMFRYPEALKLSTDPTYDQTAFEEVLESKTGDDHTKLLQMLDTVNDYSIPTEELLDTYFDVDNLTSYLAFNLLMGNQDSNAQNYLLYSPLDSSRWYYICWDGDDCLNETEGTLRDTNWQIGEWTRGISNYWGVVLFNRALRLPAFREALHQKIELLRQTITPDRVAALIADYRAVVDPFTQSLPDSVYLRSNQAIRDQVLSGMPQELESSYRHYLDSLEKPMPFFQGDAEIEDGSLVLTWGESYDLDGEFLRYDVQLCQDWQFEDVLWEQKGLLDTSVSLPLPEAGEYYWRVTVANESGHTQSSFDSVITDTGAHNGMRRFTITQDGTVVNPE